METTIETIDATDFEFNPPPAASAENESPFAELAAIAESSRPELPDHHEPRFGVSLLFPLHIAKRNCYTKFGNYKNMNYLPPLALIPFYTIQIEIPAEQRASTVEGESASEILESLSGAFDINAYNASLKGNVLRQQTRSAKQCADIFLSDYQSNSGIIFGCEVFEELQNLDYNGQANRIYSTVLPVNDASVFPDRLRTVLGYQVKGPFTDDIKKYLESAASTRAIEDSGLTRDFKIKAHAVREQLLITAKETLERCKSTIATKNSEIQKGSVAGYDQPNYRQKDAPHPPDLLMMAHAKIAPLQEEEMERARLFAEGASNRSGTGEKLFTLEEAKAHLVGDEAFMQAITANVLKSVGLPPVAPVPPATPAS
jgi:hypothetical protein